MVDEKVYGFFVENNKLNPRNYIRYVIHRSDIDRWNNLPDPRYPIMDYIEIRAIHIKSEVEDQYINDHDLIFCIWDFIRKRWEVFYIVNFSLDININYDYIVETYMSKIEELFENSFEILSLEYKNEKQLRNKNLTNEY